MSVVGGNYQLSVQVVKAADFWRRACVRKTLLLDTPISLSDGAQARPRLGTSHTLKQFIKINWTLGSSHPHGGFGTATGHGGWVGARTASASAPARGAAGATPRVGTLRRGMRRGHGHGHGHRHGHRHQDASASASLISAKKEWKMPAPVASAPSLPAVMRALRTKSLLRRADARPDAEATVMPLKLAMSTCARYVRRMRIRRGGAACEVRCGARAVSLGGGWSRGDGAGVLVGCVTVRSHHGWWGSDLRHHARLVHVVHDSSRAAGNSPALFHLFSTNGGQSQG